jgi:hypothetical protein
VTADLDFEEESKENLTITGGVVDSSVNKKHHGRSVAISKIVAHFDAHYNRRAYSDGVADSLVLGDIVRRIIKELRIPIRRSDLLHVVEKSINEILFVDEEYVRIL